MKLGESERVLLARLIEAENADRDRPFGVLHEVSSSGLVLSILHPGISDVRVDGGTLRRLEHAGLLIVESRAYGYPQSFYLDGRAADELADAVRESGGSTPLDDARAEVDRLELRLAAIADTRRRTAERFGRLVRWIVLPIVLLVIAAVAWILVGFAGAAIVVALAIAYEIVTSGFGISGASVASWAERRATDWAERKLTSWTEPEANR